MEIENSDLKSATSPEQVAEILRQVGFGSFLFNRKLSQEEVEGIRRLVSVARKLDSRAMKPVDYLAQMWAEFQIGETERSLEDADKVLSRAKMGSDIFLTALNCKLYLQVTLGDFEGASQSLTDYQIQSERAKQKGITRLTSVFNRQSPAIIAA